jgi:hypothetical protein
MTKSTKAADLLKILGQKTEGSPSPKQQPKPAAEPTTAPPTRPTSIQRQTKRPSARGRGVHLWLHPEDERLIRELSVWLLPHRRRVNESLVVKAVLRAAKTGPALLAAYDDALRLDGRLRQPKPERQ